MFYTAGWVHVICGCMFCGKTDEMLRLLRRFSIAGRSVVLIKPRLDTRTDARPWSRARAPSTRRSRSTTRARSRSWSATPISWPIEEGQFFDERLPEVVGRLADAGKQVLVTGLDQDFRGIPFGPMPRLMALADQVTKLTAICVVCGEQATRTQRLIDGQPAPADSPLIVIGGMGDEKYEARCRLHHEVPEAEHALTHRLVAGRHRCLSESACDRRSDGAISGALSPARGRAAMSHGGAPLSRKLPAFLVALSLLAALPGVALAQTNRATLIDVHRITISKAKPGPGTANCSNRPATRQWRIRVHRLEGPGQQGRDA